MKFPPFLAIFLICSTFSAAIIYMSDQFCREEEIGYNIRKCQRRPECEVNKKQGKPGRQD